MKKMVNHYVCTNLISNFSKKLDSNTCKQTKKDKSDLKKKL